MKLILVAISICFGISFFTTTGPVTINKTEKENKRDISQVNDSIDIKTSNRKNVLNEIILHSITITLHSKGAVLSLDSESGYFYEDSNIFHDDLVLTNITEKYVEVKQGEFSRKLELITQKVESNFKRDITKKSDYSIEINRNDKIKDYFNNI